MRTRNVKKESRSSGIGTLWSRQTPVSGEASTSTMRLSGETGSEGGGTGALPAQDATRNVQFKMSAAPGSTVFVAGTFNDWNPTAVPLIDNPDSGHFRTSIVIPKGRHEYKFVVNGVWCVDPNCPESVLNTHGSLNSVIHV